MTDANETIASDAVRHETMLVALNNMEPHWTWKAGIRGILSVLDVVAIGCCAYILAHPSSLDANRFLLYNSYFSDAAMGSIIVLGISLLWCISWIVVPLVLKPTRPFHPGIAVGFDLLLWMGLIVVALFSLSSIFMLFEFGSGAILDDPSARGGNNYTGSYYLAPNNTWIYNVTSTRPDYDSGHYNYTTGQYEYNYYNISDFVRSCTPGFATCVDQDAYVNGLWHERSRRLAVNFVIEAVEWIGVLAHFAVFVWACVDTHRHNRSKHSRQGQLVVDKIIADMERKGLIRKQNGFLAKDSPSTTDLFSRNEEAGVTERPALPPRPKVGGPEAGVEGINTT